MSASIIAYERSTLVNSEKYIGYVELEIAPCGLPDYVELQFRNPVNKPFDEGVLGIVLVLPLRQSSVQGEPHGTISKIPEPSNENVKVT